MRPLLSTLLVSSLFALAVACDSGGSSVPTQDSSVADAPSPDTAGSADTAAPDTVASEAGAADVPWGRVVGTLTLPGTAVAKPWTVRLTSVAGVPNPAIVGQATGLTTGGTTLEYSIPDVHEGTYFVLGFVDVDSSGGNSSTPGDYAGWFGHSGDGNPPAAPNALVRPGTTSRFDFTLVVR